MSNSSEHFGVPSPITPLMMEMVVMVYNSMVSYNHVTLVIPC